MLNVQLAASQIVQQVLLDGRNLNQALEESLARKSGWEPSKRAALQDLSYGTLRFYGELNAVLRALSHKPISDIRIRHLLLVALYQLKHSSAAQYAVVDHAVKSAATLNPRVRGLVNAILRNFLRCPPEIREEAGYNHLDWWVDELKAQYGEAVSAAMLEAGNGRPPMTLRVNRRRITPDDYLAKMAGMGIVARRIGPDALQLEKPVAVDRLPGFFEGLVSVQDAGAQLAAGFLDAKRGMRVLDACAAPGGKTAHILELSDVELVALDKDEKRLQRVRENLQRLGLQAKLLAGDAANPEGWWDGRPFDRILADVPCSASGVVRRHPDIKWLRRKEDISSFAIQQEKILQSLWALLNPGGKLLYATCSVFRQENQEVVERFLARTPQACLADLPEGQLLPNDQHDVFFYALLQKTA